MTLPKGPKLRFLHLEKFTYVQKCRLMRFNALYEQALQSVVFILLHI